jgi:uncharacterized metal-binding protein YceD (DUF177 family)
MNENFIIPLNGLTAGKNEFFLHAGKEFFESFENEEILDADLQIRILVEKSGRYIGVDCDIEGVVTVECDRCLEELEIPVDLEVLLSVKFDESESLDETQDGEREVIFLPVDNTELDMKQIVYDYVCVSLPMQRVHEDGDCNPEAMKYYGAPAGPEDSAEEDGENPFAALKNMFK